MIFRETENAPLEGSLNTNVFVTDQCGNVFLKRYPRENPLVMDFIEHEQYFLGFTNHGGKFRRRTPEEQAHFSSQAAQRGLRVLPPVYRDEKGFNYYSFLSGVQTLDTYLPNATEDECNTIAFQLFEDLQHAHNEGFIYGDRWSENILIMPGYGVLHIDFDLEVYGPAARELEVAQVAFYTLSGGKDKVLPMLGTLLGKEKGWVDIRTVEHFTKQLAVQFQQHPTYGNTVNDSMLLFDLVHAQYSRR